MTKMLNGLINGLENTPFQLQITVYHLKTIKGFLHKSLSVAAKIISIRYQLSRALKTEYGFASTCFTLSRVVTVQQ